MNFNLVMPTTIDLLHLTLATTATVLLIALFVRPRAYVGVKSRPTDSDEQAQEARSESALQLLGLLQKEARLVDFFLENLEGFEDADIGAAARVVHAGGQKVMNDHLKLVPVRKEAKASSITLDPNVSAQEVEVSGNIEGGAPYTGTLLHKGWRAQQIKLPTLNHDHDPSIIAPAKVEL